MDLPSLARWKETREAASRRTGPRQAVREEGGASPDHEAGLTGTAGREREGGGKKERKNEERTGERAAGFGLF